MTTRRTRHSARGWRALLLLAAVTVAVGCKTRPLVLKSRSEGPTDMTVPPDMRLQTGCRQHESHQVDVLFVVDNSGSIQAMQAELLKRFPEFFKVFYDLAARGTGVDLHVGVITTDYGAGLVGATGCDPSPGGQGGRLQGVGAGADANCLGPVGANYLRYDFAPNGSNNLPDGQDLSRTVGCMAAVGADGCGSEHPLESTYAALHLADNAGFVRDDALLVVAFVTNEDDCSAPADTDLFEEAYLEYGYANSFRCTHYGIVCGSPPMPPPYGASSGPLVNCQPAPNVDGKGPGKLFDVSRYIDLFTRPRAMGGLKDDPANVVLVSIAAPSDAVETILTDPQQPWDSRDYVTCAVLQDKGAVGPWCVPTLQRSCRNLANRTFFGDPAVRLNAVVAAAKNHAIMPICDDDYSDALAGIANLGLSHLSECCLPVALPADPGAPGGVATDCVVKQSVGVGDATVTTELISCAGNPGLYPCWRIESRSNCAAGSPQSLGVVVDRGGQPTPDHTTIEATCAARD